MSVFDNRLSYGDECPVCGRQVKSVVESRSANGPRVYNGECSQHKRDGGSRHIFHAEGGDAELLFSAQEYATLLAWFMVSDPWPLSQVGRNRIESLLSAEARARGWSDWSEAYHEMGEDHD